MHWEFTTTAENEFLEAIEWYDLVRWGLGEEFSEEVHSVINVICTFPDLWSFLRKPVRRALLHRFPYGVLYHFDENGTILILAVMHLHRKPDYWIIASV